MLRRPPTTLTLTPTDIAAYETSRAQRLAKAASEAKRRQRQKLKEKQRKEQISPPTNNPKKLAGARQANTTESFSGGRQRGGKSSSGQAESLAQRQAQAQAQRIFGREAGSVGPIINDDEDDEDDEDLDVTLPTVRGSIIRGESGGRGLFPDNTTLQRPPRDDLDTTNLPSDTETDTETDNDEAGNVQMDVEHHNASFDYRRNDDDDDGEDGSRGGSSNLTIQGRTGASQSQAARGQDQADTSRNQNTSSAYGRNNNSQTRQAAPLVPHQSTQPAANSDIQDDEGDSSLPPSHNLSKQLPATKAVSVSIPATHAIASPIVGEKREDNPIDLHVKRRHIARLPRRQWA